MPSASPTTPPSSMAMRPPTIATPVAEQGWSYHTLCHIATRLDARSGPLLAWQRDRFGWRSGSRFYQEAVLPADPLARLIAAMALRRSSFMAAMAKRQPLTRSWYYFVARSEKSSGMLVAVSGQSQRPLSPGTSAGYCW